MPASTFADLGVPAGLSSRLAERGIVAPTAIQAATLPDALAGRDVCGRAPTGSGKTLAFGLAVATKVKPARPGRPRGLVLVPTRELASQVAAELHSVLGPQRKVLAVYGGTSYVPQRRALRRGVEVIVACPGRLEDLVGQGDVDLGEVDIAVLDEADRLADMGFLPAVRRLLDATPAARQTLLFSATLDGEVEAVTRRYQREPVRHDACGDDTADAADVSHHFWLVERAERVGVAADTVRNAGRAMIFCRTRHGADRLGRQLTAAGLGAAVIHGDRTQAQRERALAAFASGRVAALVATDVAARGIHVDQVPCVIHFDPVDDHKAYIHRSGRTGRAGASGTVVSLVSPEQAKAVGRLGRDLGVDVRLATPGAFTDGIGVSQASARPAGVTEDRSAGGGVDTASGPRPGGRDGAGVPRRRAGRPGPRPLRGGDGRTSGERPAGDRSTGDRPAGDRRRSGAAAKRSGETWQRGTDPGAGGRGARSGDGRSRAAVPPAGDSRRRSDGASRRPGPDASAPLRATGDQRSPAQRGSGRSGRDSQGLVAGRRGSQERRGPEAGRRSKRRSAVTR